MIAGANIAGNSLQPNLSVSSKPAMEQYRAFGRNISNLPQKLGFQLGKFDKPQPAKVQPIISAAVESADTNPQECTEYLDEIEQHTRSIETKYCVKPNYMVSQPDINEKMRAILVDWIVDVHLKFKLFHETLFLAVNILDRFLERTTVSRQKLQLVGITSMLIASKYEEIYPPEIKDFVYIADNAYTKDEVIEMEQQMLRELGFEFNAPSSLRFLQNYSKRLGANPRTHNLALYLIELALVEYRLVKHRPSQRAAAALYFANRLINKDLEWDAKMGEKIGYKEVALKQCAKELAAIMQSAGRSSLQAVKRKYGLPIYMNVSAIKIGKRS